MEMEISRSSLPISDGRMLVDFSMSDWEIGWDSEGESDDYKTDAVSSSSTDTSTWIEISCL